MLEERADERFRLEDRSLRSGEKHPLDRSVGTYGTPLRKMSRLEFESKFTILNRGNRKAQISFEDAVVTVEDGNIVWDRSPYYGGVILDTKATQVALIPSLTGHLLLFYLSEDGTLCFKVRTRDGGWSDSRSWSHRVKSIVTGWLVGESGSQIPTICIIKATGDVYISIQSIIDYVFSSWILLT